MMPRPRFAKPTSPPSTMKQISILAVIILLIAAVVFFLRDKGARAELQNAEKQVATLSKEVAKVNTIMMMHNVTNSELKKDIAKTIDRLTALSNRVAKAGEDLKEAQQEHKTLQTRFEQESKKARDAEMRAAQLDGEV